jgi:hypothetical protein
MESSIFMVIFYHSCPATYSRIVARMKGQPARNVCGADMVATIIIDRRRSAEFHGPIAAAGESD